MVDEMSDKIKSRPYVSIIIPIYNVEKYLTECLESVIGQTLENIEIICVNDGSTDESLNIIEEYAKKDKRIILVTGSNQGYGHAINSGLAIANGMYIGIVESDDYILPEMYETLYSVAENNPEIDIIKSDAIRFVREGEKEDCTYISVCKSNLYNRIISIIDEPDCFNAYMINTTGIYKRDLFIQNAIKLNESRGAAYQDNGLWFQLFTSASQIIFIDKAFYMYRMDRADSSTNCTTFENALCIFGEWKYIYTILNGYELEKRKKYLPVYILRYFGSCFYHFTRVLEEYKFIFLKDFSEELNHLMETGDLCVDLLKPQQCEDLFLIMENPNIFYYNWCNQNIQEILNEKSKKSVNLLNQKVVEKNILNNHCRERINEKKISVIIPVYNVEQTIRQCLKSVLNQSLKELEVICIDDGSTDKSLSILCLYSMQDSRIIVNTQNNSGAGVARNEGLKIAKGEFIAFIDPDDEYPDNDVLRCLYTNAKKNKVNICGGNTLICGPKGMTRNEEIFFEKEGIWLYQDWQKAYGYSQFIYRREFLEKNKIVFPEYRRFQDPPFFVRAMVEAKEFYAINKEVYQYNFQPDHVKWNEEKICDLVRGIKDCIIISKENNLSKLHYETVMLLEKSFFDRIFMYANQNDEIIRQLAITETEIDTEIMGEFLHRNIDVYKLSVLDKILDRLKSETPKGYIGPNAFKNYMNLKNEISLLKVQILEIQTSISYRLGVLFSGGKKRAYRNGELIEPAKLYQWGIAFDIKQLQNDKAELEKIAQNMRASKILKRGHALTALFRLVQH